MAMQISRRNFVAGAATVGAMVAFGMAGCSSKGSGKAESKAEEYDIVIVGAGGAGMSRRMMQALRRSSFLRKKAMSAATRISRLRA